MRAEPAAEQDFTWGRLRRLIALSFRSAGRHRKVFLLVGAATLALAVAGLLVMPRTYEARCRLVIRPSRAIASRFDEWRDAPARTAARLLRSRDALRAIAVETDLARESRNRRPTILRLKDRLLSPLRRPPTDDEMLEAMTDLLEDRLRVSLSQDGSVEIKLEWPDPVMAFRVVVAAQEKFIAKWHALEVTSISDVIALLQSHAASAKVEVDGLLAELQRQERRLGVARMGAARAEAGGQERERETGRRGAGTLEARRRALALLLRRSRATPGEAPRAADPVEPRAAGSSLDVDTRLHFETLLLGPPLQSARARETAAAVPEPRPGAVRGEGDAPAPTVLSTERILLADIVDPASPLAESARAQVDEAVRWYAELLDRIEAARVELDTSSAAFEDRYIVVLPPEMPRAAVRPTPALVMLAACLDAVLLGLYVTTVVELRALARAAREAASSQDGGTP